MSITPTTDLAAKIREQCGENPYLCYQCQKCSLGCPTAQAMKYRPAVIMRAVQFGLQDLLLQDASIWRCLTCETCGTFCPNDLHPRQVIETLRCIAIDGDNGNSDPVLERGIRALKILGARIRDDHNISGDDNDNRLIWADNLPHRPPHLDRQKAERPHPPARASGRCDGHLRPHLPDRASHPEGAVPGGVSRPNALRGTGHRPDALPQGHCIVPTSLREDDVTGGRCRGAETVYFVGCVSSLYPMSYSVPQAFVSILEKAQEDYTTMGSAEWCCGYPLLIGGQVTAAKSVIRHNIETVKSLGAKRVVMTCPSCYHSWRHVYPEVTGEMNFEVVHASQLLAEMLDCGRLPMVQGRKMVVTYHDPCDLGRKGGIYDAPRQVLEAIPGVTLVEMSSRRETALCCGGGGNLETFDPDLGAQVAAQRVAEAQAVGAQVIASACPQCERTLTKSTRAAKVRIRVMDLTQLVERALA